MKDSARSCAALIVGAVALLYLINPTMGLFEIIPDAFPLIGNLDEATATALLLMVLRYFGIDLTGFLVNPPAPPPSRGHDKTD